DPLDGVARCDSERGGHEREVADANHRPRTAPGLRLIIFSWGRLHSWRRARQERDAERPAPQTHFFVRTFARTCSACARCAATAGLTSRARRAGSSERSDEEVSLWRWTLCVEIGRAHV